MTALDKLRAIDKAASPGEWKVNDSNENGDRYVGPDPAYCLIVMSPEHLMLGAKGDTEATAQLAALSKLLLPAYEALHGSITPDGHTRGCACGAKWCQDRESVFKALEEALKD